MSESSLITALAQWQRVGRGRSLQFFATDEEVQAWLNHALPEEFAPYVLVGVDKIKQSRFKYVDEPFQCDVSALSACMSGPVGRRSDFWICSKVLTPELLLRRGIWQQRLFSSNGLVDLAHGMMVKVRNPRDPAQPLEQYASAVGIVDKIQNLETGEVRQYEGYLRIYQALRKVIRKELVYSSVVRAADGTEAEDTSVALMTEGAVRAYAEGIPYINRPGRRLKPSKK